MAELATPSSPPSPRVPLPVSSPHHASPLITPLRSPIPAQLRFFSIEATSAAAATLYVTVDAPVSAIYIRRDQQPDPSAALYDASAQLALAPRWGCSTVGCASRTQFALSVTNCEPDAAVTWHVAIGLDGVDQLTTTSDAVIAGGAPAVDLRPARFFVTMVLHPLDLVQTASSPIITYGIAPAAAGVEDSLASITGGTGARFVGTSSMRHFRVRDVSPTLGAFASVSVEQGSLRALYLQPDTCAVSSSGRSATGGESSACGPENHADCHIDWMTSFNQFDLAKLYRASGSVQEVPLTALTASIRGSQPRDWWISLEANVEDVATFGVRALPLALLSHRLFIALPRTALRPPNRCRSPPALRTARSSAAPAVSNQRTRALSPRKGIPLRRPLLLPCRFTLRARSTHRAPLPPRSLRCNSWPRRLQRHSRAAIASASTQPTRPSAGGLRSATPTILGLGLATR